MFITSMFCQHKDGRFCQFRGSSLVLLHQCAWMYGCVPLVSFWSCVFIWLYSYVLLHSCCYCCCCYCYYYCCYCCFPNTPSSTNTLCPVHPQLIQKRRGLCPSAVKATSLETRISLISETWRHVSQRLLAFWLYRATSNLHFFHGFFLLLLFVCFQLVLTLLS